MNWNSNSTVKNHSFFLMKMRNDQVFSSYFSRTGGFNLMQTGFMWKRNTLQPTHVSIALHTEIISGNHLHSRETFVCNVPFNAHWLTFLLFLITNVNYVLPMLMYVSCCGVSQASGMSIMSLSTSVCQEQFLL